ncbi:MAG: hypothetical protein IJQ73_03675 [Kiritimatiellae bacterium]|nr:hypothetical protein [Kiritimatiellia bacterium]
MSALSLSDQAQRRPERFSHKKDTDIIGHLSLAAGGWSLAVGGWHPRRLARQATSNNGNIMANFPHECQNKLRMENGELDGAMAAS